MYGNYQVARGTRQLSTLKEVEYNSKLQPKY